MRGTVLKMDTESNVSSLTVEDVSKRLQAMELNLLGSGSFRDLGKALNGEYRRLLGAESLSLLVFRRDDVEFDLPDDCADTDGSIHIVDAQRYVQRLDSLAGGFSTEPYSESNHAHYFPSSRSPSHASSVTLIPLSRRAVVIGVLAFAVPNAWHSPILNDRTRLNRLAAIVAVCVENLYTQALIRQVSLRDPLTGLYNRRYFEEYLGQSLALSRRSGKPLCCLLLDIDHFKQVNDRYGHAFGDAVLLSLAETLQAHLRSGEVVSRIGGEEFCVVVADAGLDIGEMVAERIRGAAAALELAVPGGEIIAITVSCGVASTAQLDPLDPAKAPTALQELADAALYSAKQQGRNRVVVAT